MKLTMNAPTKVNIASLPPSGQSFLAEECALSFLLVRCLGDRGLSSWLPFSSKRVKSSDADLKECENFRLILVQYEVVSWVATPCYLLGYCMLPAEISASRRNAKTAKECGDDYLKHAS